MLQLRQLDYAINGKSLLSDIHLDIKAGQLTGIIGTNGAGKSTLLKLLAGIIQPERGQIIYRDQDMGKFTPSQWAEKISWLSQSREIHWPLTTEQVIGLATLHPAQHKHAISDIMARLEMRELTNRNVQYLSGGERAMVLLARFMVGNAPILLADEPLQALDPRRQLQFINHLKHAAQNGQMVIVVLHDLSLAFRFCDELVLLEKGKILSTGNVETLRKNGHIETSFGVEFLHQTHKDEVVTTAWKIR